MSTVIICNGMCCTRLASATEGSNDVSVIVEHDIISETENALSSILQLHYSSQVLRKSKFNILSSQTKIYKFQWIRDNE